MPEVASAFTTAVASVSSTFGDIVGTVQDGIAGFRDVFSPVVDNIGQAVVQMKDNVRSAISAMWDDHPFISMGVVAAIAWTFPIWIQVVMRLLKNVPRTMANIIKTPFVFLGLAR